jgi:hypothetical protein
MDHCRRQDYSTPKEPFISHGFLALPKSPRWPVYSLAEFKDYPWDPLAQILDPLGDDWEQRADERSNQNDEKRRNSEPDPVDRLGIIAVCSRRRHIMWCRI